MLTSARPRTRAGALRAAGLPACSLAGVLWLAACTSEPARVALQGDLPALKASIATAEKQNQLGASRLKELAGAVLRRELVAAPLPDDAFRDVAPCAREIRPVLEDVANGSSEFAPDATLALLDAGLGAPGGSAQDPTAESVVEAGQALGARAGGRRRALMLHGDAEVRRAALSASLAAADRADLSSVSEAARLDPDPEARRVAVGALGRIGGELAVLALMDLYTSAEPALRREIIHAWAEPASLPAGGRTQLEMLAAGTGEASVLAASALESQAPGQNALSSAALVRGIESKAADVRLLALYIAPWSNPEVREAALAARKHEDPATRVLVLLRLVEAGGLDAEASQELERLATDNVTPVGVVARATLARAGRGTVKAALRADLATPHSERRTLAALGLFTLSDWAGTAYALGDDSPRVRRAVACQVLAEPGARKAALAWTFREPAFGASAPDVVPLLLSGAPG